MLREELKPQVGSWGPKEKEVILSFADEGDPTSSQDEEVGGTG
jgi:hypothetical protein